VSFYGYMTAVLTAYFLADDPHEAMVATHMNDLSSYLRQHDYPRRLTRKIKAYFSHFYENTSTFDDVQMLHQLPYTLHTEAAAFLVKKLSRQFVVFSNIDNQVIALILKVLKPMTCQAEAIVKIGQPANTMFLIQKGVVNLTSRTGEVHAQFRSGHSFMEYSAFRMIPTHLFNAVAVGPCELHGIHAGDVAALATDLPTGMNRHAVLLAVRDFRHNVVLLEQFRAYNAASQVGLDDGDAGFDERVASLGRPQRKGWAKAARNTNVHAAVGFIGSLAKAGGNSALTTMVKSRSSPTISDSFSGISKTPSEPPQIASLMARGAGHSSSSGALATAAVLGSAGAVSGLPSARVTHTLDTLWSEIKAVRQADG